MPRSPRVRAVAGTALVCALTACGGGSPSAPTAPLAAATPDPALPSGTVFELVAGQSGEPVVGARVTVGGQTYTTDLSGRVSLREPAAYGSLLDVVAPDFLDRQTLVRRDDSRRLVLWPRSTRYFDESYTLELVYTAATPEAGVTGAEPLERVRRGTTEAVVVPSSEILADDRARQSHFDAVAVLNAALGGRLTYVISPTRPASGVVFEAKIDPADPLCTDRTLGYARNSVRSGEIVSGTIVYCRPEEIGLTLVAHELGHTVGLHHSPSGGDVMYRYIPQYGAPQFSTAETLTMGLLFERLAGNRYPDNDRQAAAAGATGTHTTICR